ITLNYLLIEPESFGDSSDLASCYRPSTYILVGKANLRTNSWLLEVNSTQLALKLAASKALIIHSSGFLTINTWRKARHTVN
ncbi:hypothetical protein CWC03_13485, partial [Pseudoalteromonas sp. S2755]